jgi:hypothetical protein
MNYGAMVLGETIISGIVRFPGAFPLQNNEIENNVNELDLRFCYFIQIIDIQILKKA